MATPQTNKLTIDAGLVKAKTYARLHQIARYSVTGRMKDAEIAEMVGISPSALAKLKQSDIYKDIYNGVLEGRITQMDEALAADAQELRNYCRQAVPVAMRALVETVQQRRDLRSCLTAAVEILDRDPDRAFVKVSRAASGESSRGSEFNPGADAQVIAQITSSGVTVAAQMRGAGPNQQAATNPVVVIEQSSGTDSKAQTDTPASGADEQPVPEQFHLPLDKTPAIDVDVAPIEAAPEERESDEALERRRRIEDAIAKLKAGKTKAAEA
jgi:hypothetical protein